MCDRAAAGLVLALVMASAVTGMAAANDEPVPLWSGALPEPDPDCVDSVHLYLDNPREAGAGIARAEVGARHCARAAEVKPHHAAVDGSTPEITRVRGAWVWREAVWAQDPDRLIERALAADLSTLYVAVSIREGAVDRPDSLARLIERASAHGLDVHVVEGDPRMISGYGLDHARMRAQALAAFNRNHPRSPIAGLQYDIEPYLLERYASAPEQTFADWASALGELSSAYGAPVEIVVPFWITEAPGGAAALAAAAPSASRFTVMAYRTTPETIRQVALPLLVWGEAHGKPVSVALEMGILPDETARVYRREARGELTLEQTGGAARARLHDETVEAQTGRPAFTYSHSVTTPASRISFSGNYAALHAAAEAVEPDFLDFTSYAGLVIHGLIE